MADHIAVTIPISPHRPLKPLIVSTLGWLIPLLMVTPAVAAEKTTVLGTVNVEANAVSDDAATSRQLSTSATKTTTPLSKTPQSISVVTAEDITSRGADSVADALGYASGVVSNYRGTSNRNDEVMARGMGGYLPQYLDGISFASGSSGASLSPQIDPWLLDKIELIHGPASVLYGQSAPGGLLSLTSKRPVANQSQKLELGYGTDNQRLAAFDLGGAATDSSSVIYRLSGITRARDGQEQFVKEERYAIAPAITFLPNDQFSFTLLANLQKDPDAGYRNFLPAEGTVLSNPNGQIPRDFFVSDPNWEKARREQNSVGYVMEYVVNDQLTLRQNARFTRLKQQTRTVIYDSWANSQQTVMNRWAQQFDDDVKSSGIDNQLQYQFQTAAVAHTVLAGVDYKHYQYDNKSWSDRDADNDLDLDWTSPHYGLDTSLLTLSSVTNELQKRNQFGVYLQDQMSYGRWNVLLSGRHDRAKIQVDNRLKQSEIDDSASKSTGRGGLLYTFDNGLAPYISYATSFEPITTTDANGKLFAPTTARQSEIGLKYAPAHRDLQASVALYDLRQQNLVTTNPQTRVSEQTGEVGSKGLEFESQLGLSESLRWSTSYAYTDSQTRKSDNPAEIGLKTQWIPRHSGASWLSYAFDSGITTGAGVRYVGSTYSRNNQIKVPDYTLADLSISYDLAKANSGLKGAQAKLTVKNLFDHEYVSTCSATWACFYGEGRSAMASLGYTW